MAWDGAGNYVLSPTYYPEVNGTVIDAVRYNGLMTDLQTALNNVVAKDGQVAVAANLAMGSFKLTGLGAGSANGDSVRFEQVWRNGTGTIASAATTELGSSAAGVLTISGTTTITSFGSTAETGQMKAVVFSGILTLTHNATSLILPTEANITTAAGDGGVFIHLGSGNWKCLSFQRADGSALSFSTFADGSVGTPAGSFTSDTNTGFYRSGTDTFAIAGGGEVLGTFAGTGAGTKQVSLFGGITSGASGITLNTESGQPIALTGSAITLTSEVTGITLSSVGSSGNGAIAINAGDGDAISITTASPAGTSAAGAISITAGTAGVLATAGANVTIQSGGNQTSDASNAPGAVNIYSGTGYRSGNINIQAGAAGTKNTVDTGNVNILAYDYGNGTPSLFGIRLKSYSGHIVHSGSVPAISSGAGSGASILGTRNGFQLTLGTGAGTTIVVKIDGTDTTTGADDATNAPFAVVNYRGGTTHCRVSATSTTEVTITTASALSGGAVLDVLLFYWE